MGDHNFYVLSAHQSIEEEQRNGQLLTLPSFGKSGSVSTDSNALNNTLNVANAQNVLADLLLENEQFSPLQLQREQVYTPLASQEREVVFPVFQSSTVQGPQSNHSMAYQTNLVQDHKRNVSVT